MKVFLFFGFCFIAISCLSQKGEQFMLKGRILDPDSLPVENAYVINIRDLSIYSTRFDGRFNIWVEPDDSLIVNHISFLRKKIYANSVRSFPDIFLEFDTIMIKQVNVGIDENRQNKNLEKTMEFIKNDKVIMYKRMNPETNLVNQTVTENNIVFRSQASSVSLVKFSPTDVIGLLINDKKKNQKLKGFTFYRNEKQKARKEKRKTENK